MNSECTTSSISDRISRYRHEGGKDLSSGGRRAFLILPSAQADVLK